MSLQKKRICPACTRDKSNDYKVGEDPRLDAKARFCAHVLKQNVTDEEIVEFVMHAKLCGTQPLDKEVDAVIARAAAYVESERGKLDVLKQTFDALRQEIERLEGWVDKADLFESAMLNSMGLAN